MKLCKDCVNFRYPIWCEAPENGTSPLDGNPISLNAMGRRDESGKAFGDNNTCGPDAKYFSPKPPIKRKWWQVLVE